MPDTFSLASRMVASPDSPPKNKSLSNPSGKSHGKPTSLKELLALTATAGKAPSLETKDSR